MTSDVIENYIFDVDEKVKYWGEREWVYEPDELKFEHQGLQCLILRVWFPENMDSWYGGYLRAFVLLPENHLWNSGYYRELDVHRGITFRSRFHNRAGDWLGFNCAHDSDICPSLEVYKTASTHPMIRKIQKTIYKLKQKTRVSSALEKSYKNTTHVEEHCRRLADQINKSIQTLVPQNDI